MHNAIISEKYVGHHCCLLIMGVISTCVTSSSPSYFWRRVIRDHDEVLDVQFMTVVISRITNAG